MPAASKEVRLTSRGSDEGDIEIIKDVGRFQFGKMNVLAKCELVDHIRLHLPPAAGHPQSQQSLSSRFDMLFLNGLKKKHNSETSIATFDR